MTNWLVRLTNWSVIVNRRSRAGRRPAPRAARRWTAGHREETGAGAWSDDALARAIREGVGHDGRALFTLMPYQGYRVLSDDDLAAIVAYLQTLAPVAHRVDNDLEPTPCPVCGLAHGGGDKNIAD